MIIGVHVESISMTVSARVCVCVCVSACLIAIAVLRVQQVKAPQFISNAEELS